MKYFYEQISKKDGVVLRGVVNTPDDFDKNKKYPTVIMYHGFGGDRDGRTWMRIQNAKHLTQRGYIVVRFDFSGTNESDGNFYDMTVTRELYEANMIYDFTKMRSYVDKDRIYFIGHSLGGVISTLIGAKINPRAIALLAPASDMNNIDYLKLAVQIRVEDEYDNLSEIEKIKKIKDLEDLDIGGEKLHRRFWLDFFRYDIYEAAEKYKGNVLILRGNQDELVFKDSNEKLNKAFPHSKYEEIDGADHSFTNYDHRQIIFDKMYDFFEENK